MSANCELCGEPMPAAEEIFKYHGYSCECPKPPLPKPVKNAARILITTPSLPDEVAGLIEELHQIKTLPASALPSTRFRLISPEMLDKLITALRALAQENARLKGGLNVDDAEFGMQEHLTPNQMQQRIRELQAGHDAIQAKTIEECVKICEPIEGEHFPPSWDATDIERHHAIRRWCAAAIRALAQSSTSAQTDEIKTNVAASADPHA